jgi:hypothetical protein
VQRENARPCLVEVKPSSQLSDPQVQRTLCAYQAYAERKHMKFALITEKAFVDVRFSNIANLTPYRNGRSERPDAILELQCLLSINGGMTLNEIASLATDAPDCQRLIRAAYHQMYHGEVKFDIDEPITRNTRLEGW